MGGAARFVRTLIPRGRYLPFGSCPCRSRGFDIWRPPAMQGHGGFATPTAEAAPPIRALPSPAQETSWGERVAERRARGRVRGFGQRHPHPPTPPAWVPPSPAVQERGSGGRAE